jgi:hypothetical protein
VQGLKYRLAVRLADRLRHWTMLADGHHEAARHARGSRLSDEDVARLAKEQAAGICARRSHHVERVRREYRHLEEAFDDAEDHNRMIVATRACARALEDDRSIETALNVGCGFDLTFYYLAQRFPRIAFTSIDFSDEARRVMGEAFPGAASLANWKTRTGYALAQLERGELSADLVLLSGVASMLPNAEWRAYLAQLSKVARVLVIADVWYAPPTMSLFRVPRPESIDADESVIMAGLEGGRYMHNHVALLAGAGFSVQSSRVLADRTYVLEIVATNPALAAKKSGNGARLDAAHPPMK